MRKSLLCVRIIVFHVCRVVHLGFESYGALFVANGDDCGTSYYIVNSNFLSGSDLIPSRTSSSLAILSGERSMKRAPNP
jgi:hypothetical protein